jgi:cyclopropane fatty-acyl-phospholipid synthase-like methyltransferase
MGRCGSEEGEGSEEREMNLTRDQIRDIVATFRVPDRRQYPELDGYTRDELVQDCSGGGGLYLATRMVRTMHLRAGDIVLDLGCGKGAASLFLAKHLSVKVIAVDLWTSATFLNQKFTARGYRNQIVPLHMDVTHELPFAEDYFDAVFCMNSFNFYGDNVEFLRHLLKHVKPGGQLCIGSEVLTDEFTEEQLENPPYVYAFRLPPPNDDVDVFEGDFKKQHTPRWWYELFENSGLLQVECCEKLDDAAVLYEEMVRYEYEHDLDPFDVEICLAQMEWERTNRPKRSLFVLTAHRL